MDREPSATCASLRITSISLNLSQIFCNLYGSQFQEHWHLGEASSQPDLDSQLYSLFRCFQHSVSQGCSHIGVRQEPG
ncbi:hypothetical protein NC652_031367 [Populus alba x Populus x berolinensis]|nr:hypothetical protein NC652_031367 [Populus alba x Populus x berolinensis]